MVECHINPFSYASQHNPYVFFVWFTLEGSDLLGKSGDNVDKNEWEFRTPEKQFLVEVLVDQCRRLLLLRRLAWSLEQ